MGSFPEWEDSLGEEMATHSRILAWKIPRTEEAGGCSLRDHRARHDSKRAFQPLPPGEHRPASRRGSSPGRADAPPSDFQAPGPRETHSCCLQATQPMALHDSGLNKVQQKAMSQGLEPEYLLCAPSTMLLSGYVMISAGYLTSLRHGIFMCKMETGESIYVNSSECKQHSKTCIIVTYHHYFGHPM